MERHRRNHRRSRFVDHHLHQRHSRRRRSVLWVSFAGMGQIRQVRQLNVGCLKRLAGVVQSFVGQFAGVGQIRQVRQLNVGCSKRVVPSQKRAVCIIAFEFWSVGKAIKSRLSVGVHKDAELKAMKDRLESSGLRTLDLTDNDLAKDHLRHLMGGRSNVENELLCRFVFPERPGALMKFLDAFSPRWNISMFHYRAQGEMGANVLVGMQVPPESMEEFAAQANTLGYEYDDERENEAFRLLMH